MKSRMGTIFGFTGIPFVRKEWKPFLDSEAFGLNNRMEMNRKKIYFSSKLWHDSFLNPQLQSSSLYNLELSKPFKTPPSSQSTMVFI